MRRSTANIRLKRFGAAALLFGVALALGACGGTVADMWPHWAGGEPAGLPPRPGQPGYEQFIAHGQPGQNAAAAPAPAPQGPAGTTATIAEQRSAAQPPRRAEPSPEQNSEAEAVEHPASDTGVVRGGLY